MAQERPSAVRLYAPDHPALAITVRSQIEQQRNKLIEENGTGNAQDWGDYKSRAGVIMGLDLALQICINIESEIRRQES